LLSGRERSHIRCKNKSVANQDGAGSLRKGRKAPLDSQPDGTRKKDPKDSSKGRQKSHFEKIVNGYSGLASSYAYSGHKRDASPC
jgi:hypothetical protein